MSCIYFRTGNGSRERTKKDRKRRRGPVKDKIVDASKETCEIIRRLRNNQWRTMTKGDEARARDETTSEIDSPRRSGRCGGEGRGRGASELVV